MYILESSDVNNKDILQVAEENKERALKSASADRISYIIFNEEINDKLFRKLKIYLTLSDEFKIPLNKKMANILFFALCVNNDNKIELSIKNLSQAQTIYDLYNNDFRKVQPEKNDKRVNFTKLKTDHGVLFPGCDITWKIPVAFFRYEEEQKVTLSGSAFCYLNINSEDYKVPRFIFMNFFKESLIKGRIITNSTDEIKEKFDVNNKGALKETFQYLGFSMKPELRNIKLPQNGTVCSISDNKLVCYTKAEMNELWFQLEEFKYVLLPKLNYLPIKGSDIDLINLIS